MSSQRIHRHILCSTSLRSAQVAGRVLELSRCGMSEPPLEHFELIAGSGAEELAVPAEQMELACNRLADLGRAQRQRLRGLELAAPDELRLWLLLDLMPAQEDDPQGTSAHPDPSGVAALQAVLEHVAWQRLRAHIAWNVVLLLEAADQAALVQWVEALRSSGDARLHIISPVNAQHLRLAPHEWREQAAQSVAALLWAGPPAHTQFERAATAGATLAAAGALVWSSPAAALHGWLVQAGAERVLNALCSDLAAHPQGAVAGALLPSLQEDQATLRRLLPVLRTPAPGFVRPPWRAIARLPAEASAAGERARTSCEAQAQAARLSWLDAAQTAWAATLAALEKEHLPSQSRPQLGPYLGALQTLRAQALELAQAAGNGLEEAGKELEEASQALSDARRRLALVCGGLPACSWTGAVAAFMQPWQWPRWALAYWQHLPEAAKHLRDAQEGKLRRQIDEAAWHTLRQHYLAAAQQTQIRASRLLDAHKKLQAALDLCASTGRQQAAALPQPWTQARLAWLLDRLLPDPAAVAVADMVAALLQANPPPEAEDLMLHERVGALLAEVQAWSALDCLCAALASDAQSSVQEGKAPVVTWLEEQSQAVCPLWPSQELAENAASEEWWLIPNSRAQIPWLATAAAAAAAAAATAPHVAVTHSNLDAVQIVRWSEVQVILEATDRVSGEEESLHESPNEYS